MKVSVSQKEEEFKPITVELVFQTEKEFDDFFTIMKYDITIPAAITPSEKKRIEFSELINSIYYKLNDFKMNNK